MSLRFRALLAALIVVTVAAASALFVGYRTGVLAGQSGIDVATTGDVGELFGSGQTGGPQLAGLALRRLELVYYMPVNPQTPIAGEETTLLAGGRSLQDEPRAESHHPHVGTRQLERIERTFDVCLLPGVGGTGPPVRGPALVHAHVFGPG